MSPSIEDALLVFVLATAVVFWAALIGLIVVVSWRARCRYPLLGRSWRRWLQRPIRAFRHRN